MVARGSKLRETVTPRAVLHSFVLGSLLAVVTLPLSSVLFQHAPDSWRHTRVNDALHTEGHVVLTQRTEAFVSTTWFTTSEPLGVNATTLRLAWMEDAREATEDVRPPRLRLPLDGRHRSLAEWQVGWPWRAASSQTEQLMGPDHATETRGLWVAELYGRPVSVPYRPIWPGLFGNALVFGILALILRTSWRWRRTQT